MNKETKKKRTGTILLRKLTNLGIDTVQQFKSKSSTIGPTGEYFNGLDHQFLFEYYLKGL